MLAGYRYVSFEFLLLDFLCLHVIPFLKSVQHHSFLIAHAKDGNSASQTQLSSARENKPITARGFYDVNGALTIANGTACKLSQRTVSQRGTHSPKKGSRTSVTSGTQPTAVTVTWFCAHLLRFGLFHAKVTSVFFICLWHLWSHQFVKCNSCVVCDFMF